MRPVKVVAMVLGLVLFAMPLWSQTGTSTIRGTITDQQGRVVADATVTLTNRATNGVRTTKTTAAGTYVFDLITPAEYRLEVEGKTPCAVGIPLSMFSLLLAGRVNDKISEFQTGFHRLLGQSVASYLNRFTK